MNILFVIPKIIDIETIDEPPRLNKGNGKPVTGINPMTVEIFIIIWNERSEINPAITNLSKLESDIIKIFLKRLNNKIHNESKNTIPMKPKLYAYAANIKSVVSTGTKTLSMFSERKYCPNNPPLDINNLLCDWEKSKSDEKNSLSLFIWYSVTKFIFSILAPISRKIKKRLRPISNNKEIYLNLRSDSKSIEIKTKEIIKAVPRSGWKFISNTIPKMTITSNPLLKFFDK